MENYQENSVKENPQIPGQGNRERRSSATETGKTFSVFVVLSGPMSALIQDSALEVKRGALRGLASIFFTAAASPSDCWVASSIWCNQYS